MHALWALQNVEWFSELWRIGYCRLTVKCCSMFFKANVLIKIKRETFLLTCMSYCVNVILDKIRQLVSVCFNVCLQFSSFQRISSFNVMKEALFMLEFINYGTPPQGVPKKSFRVNCCSDKCVYICNCLLKYIQFFYALCLKIVLQDCNIVNLVR